VLESAVASAKRFAVDVLDRDGDGVLTAHDLLHDVIRLSSTEQLNAETSLQPREPRQPAPPQLDVPTLPLPSMDPETPVQHSAPERTASEATAAITPSTWRRELAHAQSKSAEQEDHAESNVLESAVASAQRWAVDMLDRDGDGMLTGPLIHSSPKLEEENLERGDVEQVEHQQGELEAADRGWSLFFNQAAILQAGRTADCACSTTSFHQAAIQQAGNTAECTSSIPEVEPSRNEVDLARSAHRSTRVYDSVVPFILSGDSVQ
jgi:hypothetical protein